MKRSRQHRSWQPPELTRAHLTLPSINSLVSSHGRLFTIEDHGSAEHPALPGKFALAARDAFNGTVLWQRPFVQLWRFRTSHGPPRVKSDGVTTHNPCFEETKR